MNKDKRIEEVDVLRGLAAIFMILGHSFIVYPVDISKVPWCASMQHYIYTFHMELFFVLAGIVYHCTSYKTYIQKKVKRILIPYLFFGGAALLLRAYGGTAVNGVEPLGEGFSKLLFHGGGYWFLYVLFLIFAVWPLADKLCDQIVYEVILLFLCLIITQLKDISNLFMIGAALHYLPFFISGCIISKICGGGYLLTEKRIQIIFLSISMLLYLGLDCIETMGGYKPGEILGFIRAMSMIVILYIIVQKCNDLWDRNVLTFWVHNLFIESGRYSLQLYLFNGYLLTILRILICNILHITAPFVIVATIWTGNIAFTLISCKWIIPKIPIVRDLCGLERV